MSDSSGDCSVDYFPQLPLELQEMICNHLDTPTLLNMSSVNRSWDQSISSLSSLWRRRYLAMAIAGPEEDVPWKERLFAAVQILRNKLKDKSAFTIFSTKLIENFPSKIHIRQLNDNSLHPPEYFVCVTYSDGLLLAGNRTGQLLVWKDVAQYPTDRFTVAPSGDLVSISMDEGVVVAGTFWGNLRVEQLDSSGVRRSTGWDLCRLQDRVVSAKVSVPLRLVVVMTTRSKYVTLVWISLETGHQLQQLECGMSLKGNGLTFVRATGTETHHGLLCITSRGLQRFRWPRHSDDGAPQGNLKALMQDINSYVDGSRLKTDGRYMGYLLDQDKHGHGTNFRIYDLDSDYTEDILLPNRGLTYRLAAVKNRFLFLLAFSHHQIRALYVVDYKGQLRCCFHFQPYDMPCWGDVDLVLAGDLPWLDDLTLWRPGQLVWAYINYFQTLFAAKTNMITVAQTP